MKVATRVVPNTLPSVLRLHALVRKSILNRGFYQRIGDNILGSPSTIDANLYFVCYLTLLASSILKNKPRIVQFLWKARVRFMSCVRQTFPNLVALVSKQFEARKIRFPFSRCPSSPSFDSTGIDAHIISTADRLSTISSYISDVRIFSRLADFLKYIPWVLESQDALLADDNLRFLLDRSLDYAKATTCLVLDALETVGWVTDHNWVATKDNAWWCAFSYVWSSRVWGAYIGAVIIALFRDTPPLKRNRAWRIKVFEQLVQIPLVLHWSLYKGCLSPFWVGMCGVGASYWRFKETWLPVLNGM